jgi:acyl-CoA thioesterase
MLREDRTFTALGMRLEVDEPGRAVISMVVREDMTNGFAITHGGMVFALADTAFAVACNEDDRVTVAAGADITFLKSTRAGDTLRATAVRRIRSGRTGLYDVTVTDAAGEVVAEFRGRSIATDRVVGSPASV